MLLDMLDKLCGRIEEFKEKGEKLDMRIVYQCFITDVITLVCFIAFYCYSTLSFPFWY